MARFAFLWVSEWLITVTVFLLFLIFSPPSLSSPSNNNIFMHKTLSGYNSNFLFLKTNSILSTVSYFPREGFRSLWKKARVLGKVHSWLPRGKYPCFLISCTLAKYPAAKQQHVGDIMKRGWFGKKKSLVISIHDHI